MHCCTWAMRSRRSGSVSLSARAEENRVSAYSGWRRSWVAPARKRALALLACSSAAFLWASSSVASSMRFSMSLCRSCRVAEAVLNPRCRSPISDSSVTSTDCGWSTRPSPRMATERRRSGALIQLACCQLSRMASMIAMPSQSRVSKMLSCCASREAFGVDVDPQRSHGHAGLMAVTDVLEQVDLRRVRIEGSGVRLDQHMAVVVEYANPVDMRQLDDRAAPAAATPPGRDDAADRRRRTRPGPHRPPPCCAPARASCASDAGSAARPGRSWRPPRAPSRPAPGAGSAMPVATSA